MSSDFVAAIDLGSNSFHMIVARLSNGQVQVHDRLREMVQLAGGLDDRNRLSEESQRRALACLARFGQRLRHIPADQIRIVGTNPLRQARNSAEFVARAEQLLGHKVEIVAGPRVLLVTKYQNDPLAAILRAQGFEVTVAEKPLELTPGALTGAKAVILNLSLIHI